MRSKRIAALLVCLALLQSGCWDKREAEDIAFVLALGIDEGEKTPYAVTAVIALPGKLAGAKEGGGEGKPFVLTTAEAPTVSAAINVLNGSIDRKISLIHTKGIFMSESLARRNAMLPMDELARFREIRRSMFLVVTKGKASEFLAGMQPVMEKDPSKFFEEMTATYRYTGMLPVASELNDFISRSTTKYASPLTYYAALSEGKGESSEGRGDRKELGAESVFVAGDLPKTGGPNIQMIGAAAFNGRDMVGVLSGEEMRIALMLQDEFIRGVFSIPEPEAPERYLALDVRTGRPRSISVDLSGPLPRIHVYLTLEAELLAVQSLRDYTDPKRQAALEAVVARSVTEQAQALIAKSQRWDADIFGFGQWVVRQFPTVQHWEAYDWPTKYPQAEINVDVRVVLRRFGLVMSPPKATE